MTFMSQVCNNQLKGHRVQDGDADSSPVVPAPPDSLLAPAVSEGSIFEEEMSLPWIKLAVGMPDHPKVMSLAWELNINKAQAVGHLCVLWTSAGRLAPKGVFLQPHAERIISTMSAWEGPAEDFVAALVKCKLLDKWEDCYAIHDWQDHAGAFIEKFRKDAERKREERKALNAEDASNGRPTDIQTQIETKKERKKRSSATADPRFQAVIDLFAQKYEKAKGAKYESTRWATEGAVLNKLLKATTATLEEFGARMDLAFLDQWFIKNTPTLMAFCASWPKYVPPAPKPKPLVISSPAQLEDFQ